MTFGRSYVGVSGDLLTDDDRRNLAHVALLVLDIAPKAMVRLVICCNQASIVKTIRQNCKNFRLNYRTFQDGLNENEKGMLENLENGIIDCDTSFLYKIIRHHRLVPTPTHGWNGEVDDLKNQGDLVETFRQIRNLVVHLPTIRLATEKILNLKKNIFQTVAVVSYLCEQNGELISEMESHLNWP
ncbi:Hypothetical predicted protein [Mytilus galloprovincialis]|uniref:DZIP3-like HEPN domain-containing protein n=1 Tax=Mytilus galloprovincialis TaxID=29158 RepID=A0A8B6DTC1_MYTGA|nr:Hypothetical predicted protein [Mytilus galloprovincialis]